MNISKPLLDLTEYLIKREWESQDAFLFSLCLYLVFCCFFAFAVTIIPFAFLPGMGILQSLIMAGFLSIPFLFGMLATTIGTYRKLGRI